MKGSKWKTSKPRWSDYLLERASRASHWAGLYEVAGCPSNFWRQSCQNLPFAQVFLVTGLCTDPLREVDDGIYFGWKFSTVDVSMLDLARFEEGRLIKEYNVV